MIISNLSSYVITIVNQGTSGIESMLNWFFESNKHQAPKSVFLEGKLELTRVSIHQAFRNKGHDRAISYADCLFLPVMENILPLVVALFS